MTVYYSTELASYNSTPVVKPDAPHAYSARVRRFRASITLASQTTSDTIVVAYVPTGMTFMYGVHATDTSLGSSTVAIGITGTTGKYKAAGTFTATDTPTLFGTAAQIANQTPLAATETVFITIAAATMPSSGQYVVDLYFSAP